MKKKKVSINAVDNVIKETYSNTEIVEWCGLEVEIKKVLSFSEMAMFVNTVVNSCFLEPAQEYAPEVKDFAIRTFVLEYYANFNMPDNVEHRYAFAYQPGAVEMIFNYIDMTQYEDIVNAIEAKIEARVLYNIEKERRQIDNIVNQLGSLESKLSDVFGGITESDISNIMSVFSNGVTDQDQLINLVTMARNGTSDNDGES